MKTSISTKQRISLSTLFNILSWTVLFCIYIFNQKEEDIVVFLDVGQGDAILIQEGNIQVLVDGGPDRSILYELPKYMPLSDRKIEYIVLTHPHDDHMIGLLHVLDNYEVGELLYYPVCNNNPNYRSLISNPVKKREIAKGDAISLITLKINIIWPIESEKSNENCYKPFDSNINNDSLVVEFQYIGRKFLLIGDAEMEVESRLMSELGKYDVLKAGHHCSKTSSSETFIKWVVPRYAICSSGDKNKYGHPSSETLKTFSKYGVQYLVTYEEGNVVFDTEDM